MESIPVSGACTSVAGFGRLGRAGFGRLWSARCAVYSCMASIPVSGVHVMCGRNVLESIFVCE